MGSFDIAQAVGVPDLSKYLGEVEAVLKTVVPANGPLQEPTKRLVESSGKKLRSALVLAVVKPHKKIDIKVITACAAIELLHLGSLVHDDIMDHSNTRWNKPTVNALEGVNTAILVGDYLFAKANFLASTVSQDIAKVVAETISKLCEGQALEFAETGNINRTKASYISAITGKTGSLVSAACKVGALSVVLGEKETHNLGNFGKYFGISFQILDDLSDLASTQELLGKPVGQDIKEGVFTLPIIRSLQGASKSRLTKLLLSKQSQKKIVDLLIQDGSITYALDEVKKYNLKAQTAIKRTVPEPIQNLPSIYTNYVTQNLLII